MISASALAYERPGSSTAQFLKIVVTPRAAAMGNSFVSITDGAEAIYYNAAALIRVPKFSFTANHTSWFADMNLEFLAAAYRIVDFGVLGISITDFSTDQMLVRTPLQPEGTGETFAVNQFRAAASFAYSLTDRVSFGLTASYFRLKMYTDMVENAFSGDISVLYQSEHRDFSFGIIIANFGSSVTYINKDYPMPLNFNFGMSMNALELPHQKVKVSLTAMKPSGGVTMIQSGIEWNLMDFLYLRGGYRFNHDLASYSMGAGLETSLGSTRVSLDYSLSAFGDFGSINRIGLRFNL